MSATAGETKSNGETKSYEEFQKLLNRCQVDNLHPKDFHEENINNWRIAILTKNQSIIAKMSNGSYTTENFMKDTTVKVDGYNFINKGFIQHLSENGFLELGVGPEDIKLLSSLYLKPNDNEFTMRYYFIDVKKLCELYTAGALNLDQITRAGIFDYATKKDEEIVIAHHPELDYTEKMPRGVYIMTKADENFRNKKKEAGAIKTLLLSKNGRRAGGDNNMDIEQMIRDIQHVSLVGLSSSRKS